MHTKVTIILSHLCELKNVSAELISSFNICFLVTYHLFQTFHSNLAHLLQKKRVNLTDTSVESPYWGNKR